MRLGRSAKDLEGVLQFLERETGKMSKHTTTFVDIHVKAVEEIAGVSDALVGYFVFSSQR